MSRALNFVIENWLGSGSLEEAGLASLRIDAGVDRVPITEVLDVYARTVRQHINVPADLVARWLLLNWWRLRWESRRREREWLFAHSLASIGEGYAWPSAEFSSDGDFIHLRAESEEAPDVAAIRFVRSAAIAIPAKEFESAIDEFVDQVCDRLGNFKSAGCDLDDLRIELREERADPELSKNCRWQAKAGIDPGSADEDWINQVRELGEATGQASIEEVLAALPEISDNLDNARVQLKRIQDDGTKIDLSWIKPMQATAEFELPWQRGLRLAAQIRKEIGVASGPINDKLLADRLGANLPLPATGAQALRGGYRNGKTTALAFTERPANQRFYIARLIGCAALSSIHDRYLPVTDAATGLQKTERSFAQEFLCPWLELDDFTDENGLDEEGIAMAADYFSVSERLIQTTLVNHRKVPRYILENEMDTSEGLA